MLWVDAAACVDCGACVTACPVDAVVPHTKLTESQMPFFTLNAEYYDAFPHADRTPLALVHEQRRLERTGPYRVAIVGAGPAGLYAADELLKHPEIKVDVFDRLPSPHGLVRFGVAPDHQKTKRVQDLFAKIERQRGFRYFLGVEVGNHLTHDELTARYHAVLYTVGAASDKALGVPGDDLPGSISATDFVGWYNGHPDKQDLQPSLDSERVVLVGNGNVALDCARILALPTHVLETTDIADGPLTALRSSKVREIVLLGRRGPAQAAFTVPELVGLLGEDELNVVVDLGDLTDAQAFGGGSQKERLIDELRKRPVHPNLRTIVLRFAAAPTALLGDDAVTGVEVGRTRLVKHKDGSVSAKTTGETEVLETGLVLRAVGYHGLPIKDLPYDEKRGVVPNQSGRVRPGVYVAGWVKRGPNGFIGTNKSDAEETVDAILDDFDASVIPEPVGTTTGLRSMIRHRQPGMVDLAGWLAIDAEERRRGEAQGRPRVKITDISEAMSIASEATLTRVARLRRGLPV